MTTGPDDRLVDPQIWESVLPSPVFNGLRRWAAVQPARIIHVRRLAAGRSGAYVAVVRIEPANGRIHHAVLKLLPPQTGDAETLGVQLAQKYTPQPFWDQHMVATTDQSSLPATDWWIHIQEMAHASLAQMRPLAERVDDPQFADLCGAILDAIVDGWHQSADPSPVHTTAPTFLDDFLAHRHLQGLQQFASMNSLSLDDPLEAVTVPGRAGSLPNPFAVLTGRLSPEPVEIYVANGHGDLHLSNILVPPTGLDNFRLIDYGRFSPQTPISRDPVKLLLAAAETWLPPLHPATALRSSLAELIVDPGAVPASPTIVGYLAVSARIHDAASRWSTQRHMRDEWHRQHLLVLLGSALRTVADTDMPSSDRWWFFEIAALAARAYVDPATGHQPTPPSVLRIPQQPPSAPVFLSPLPTPVDPSPAVPGPTGWSPPTSPLPPPLMPDSAPTGAGGPDRNAKPPAGAPRSHGFPGTVKVVFVRKLATDWEELADWLDIPPYVKQQFRAVNPSRSLWEWLEVRDRLPELPAALDHIDRNDLADILRGNVPGS